MEPLGLYIHIPFCVKKCHYCSFTSWCPRDGQQVQDYFKDLREEIKSYAGRTKEYEVRTVYFGGGTPSAVTADAIKETMEALGKAFSFDPQDPLLEKTIEVNPGSGTAEKIEAYRKMGFNRLSIGLQSAQDHLLKVLGRVHNLEDFKLAYGAAEAAGFDNVSADVMFGLPGQGLQDVLETVQMLVGLPMIKHLSCYSLKVEEGTAFDLWERQGRLALPGEELEREMYHRLIDYLRLHGFEQYEISNFSKPGVESRHNSSYWDLTDYIGLGLGASSFFCHKRWSNTADFNKYHVGLEQGYPITEGEHRLSDREARGDFMFLGLRRNRGVDDLDYQQRFGRHFFDDYAKEIQRLLASGLIVREDTRIRLSSRGMDLANQVFMAFV
ncbi:radical SAM family heme chaperone HemW [Eubacterium sp.]|uniref:radical SAM family heme chaperone HemW n=1 Tax=Eubacterium sp. TaxID=142586 RepID=UPI002FC63F01